MNVTAEGEQPDSKIVFTNNYNPTVKVALPKTAVAITDTSDPRVEPAEFHIKVEPVDNSPTVENPNDTVSIGASVNESEPVDLGNVTFDQPGTYSYIVSEIDDGKKGYKYDNKKYTVTYVVTYDYFYRYTRTIDGQSIDNITFENEYHPEPVTPDFPEVTANISGVGRNEEASFDINVVKTPDNPDNDNASEVSPSTQTVKIAKDQNSGTVDFGKVTFTKSGNYKYEVSELKGNQEGYTYDDQTRYIVEFNVKDAGGHLVSEPTIKKNDESSDKIKFVNNYKKPQPPESPSPSESSEPSESPAPKPTESSNPTPSISPEPSESAKPTDSPSPTQSTSPEPSASASPKPTESSESPATVVTPVPTVIPVPSAPSESITVNDPPVMKTITGDKPTKDSVFRFSMKADDPAYPMPEGSENGVKIVSHNGPGSVEFGKITFTAPGTYTYILSEVDNNIEGYEYDASVYRVTYVVSTDENGKLSSVRTITKDGTPCDTAEFVNHYTSSKASPSKSSSSKKETPVSGKKKEDKKKNSERTPDTRDTNRVPLFGLMLITSIAVIVMVLNKRKA